MLAMSFLVSPCSARAILSSASRVTCNTFPSIFTWIPKGTSVLSFPFGPSTRTSRLFSVTFTPLGTAMGNLPMRDTLHLSPGLPHRANQLPAHFRLLRLSIHQYPFGSRKNIDPQPLADRNNLLDSHIDPHAGSANSLQFRNHGIVILIEFQLNTKLLTHPTLGLNPLHLFQIALFD